MRAGLRVTHINGPGPQEPSSRSGAILPREGDTDTPHSPNILHVIPPPGKPAEIFSTFESRSRERGLEILTLEMRPGPGIKII